MIISHEFKTALKYGLFGIFTISLLILAIC
jgi:hypothetical protein